MRVAVAMSGGMDSTAAALLLKSEGHEVLGLYMRLHSFSETAWELAEKAAAEIGIPIRKVDLTQDFQRLVVAPFVSEYAMGRTPSPCPLCNRFIKMGLLWEEAVSAGCEKLATGHYARIVITRDGPILLRALDKGKDQSYFLFMLTREMLDRVLFPLNGVTKRQVRELVRTKGISVWETDESQELCFVAGSDYRRLLEERCVEPRPGPIMDLNGNVLGRHGGMTSFTVGQRRGLGIPGAEPLYVVRIDPKTDTVYVGTRRETYVAGVRLGKVNLLTSSPLRVEQRLTIKVRSTARAVGCKLTGIDPAGLTVLFDEPQAGVAPGQAGVLYSGARVIGGGWIEEPELK